MNEAQSDQVQNSQGPNNIADGNRMNGGQNNIDQQLQNGDRVQNILNQDREWRTAYGVMDEDIRRNRNNLMELRRQDRQHRMLALRARRVEERRGRAAAAVAGGRIRSESPNADRIGNMIPQPPQAPPRVHQRVIANPYDNNPRQPSTAIIHQMTTKDIAELHLAAKEGRVNDIKAMMASERKGLSFNNFWIALGLTRRAQLAQVLDIFVTHEDAIGHVLSGRNPTGLGRVAMDMTGAMSIKGDLLKSLMGSVINCPGASQTQSLNTKEGLWKNEAGTLEDLLHNILNRDEVDWRNADVPDRIGWPYRLKKYFSFTIYNPAQAREEADKDVETERFACRAMKVFLDHPKFYNYDLNYEDIDLEGNNLLVFTMLYHGNGRNTWEDIDLLGQAKLVPKICSYPNVDLLACGSNQISIFHLFCDVSFLGSWYFPPTANRNDPSPQQVLKSDLFDLLQKDERRAQIFLKHIDDPLALPIDLVSRISTFLRHPFKKGFHRNRKFQSEFYLRAIASLCAGLPRPIMVKKYNRRSGGPIDLIDLQLEFMRIHKDKLDKRWFECEHGQSAYQSLQEVRKVFCDFKDHWEKFES